MPAAPSRIAGRTPAGGMALWLIVALLLVLAPRSAAARISRVEITRIESPTFGGTSFGDVGPYEKLVGRAFGAVEPDDPRNATIVDLQLAKRNVRGLVEYSTDVVILRPVDPSKGNHRLLYEITNRGDSRLLSTFNDAPPSNSPSSGDEAGIGFLMRQGYTMLWTGWDPTVPAGSGALTMIVPAVQDANGDPLVGAALQEWAVDNSTTREGRLSYPAATLDQARARLSVRVRYEDRPTLIRPSGWEYVNRTTVRLLPAGTPFLPGRLYEFVYPATEPIVAGLGFAAIRDVASYFRYAARDERGANPLAGDVRTVLTFCSSQPCRAMHDFIRLGFNQDEAGRQVMDGVLNWLGAGSGIFLNYRFAQPAVTHRQHIGRWFPEFEFPFANQVTFDPVTGRTDGRLRRCLETSSCPKIFEVNSANEYWAKALSVSQLDGTGIELRDPPNVRSYYLAGLPHQPASGTGICQLPRNPLVPNPVLRALLVALDAWVSDDTAPPPSQMPLRVDGTLVPPLPQSGVGFPSIPGVVYNGRVHTGDWQFFGPSFPDGILTQVPPVLRGTPYPVYVPKTDRDGNDVAGIRIPDVAVPLATYTGWALRAQPAGANDGCDAYGQKIDFRRTRAERLAAGDPRLSIEERYPSHDDYVAAVGASAEALAVDRFLLAEDVARVRERAAASNVGRVTIAP